MIMECDSFSKQELGFATRDNKTLVFQLRVDNRFLCCSSKVLKEEAEICIVEFFSFLAVFIWVGGARPKCLGAVVRA